MSRLEGVSSACEVGDPLTPHCESVRELVELEKAARAVFGPLESLLSGVRGWSS